MWHVVRGPIHLLYRTFTGYCSLVDSFKAPRDRWAGWKLLVEFFQQAIKRQNAYNDVIMGAIASQITSLTIIYSTVYSDADHRKQNIKAPRHRPLAGNSPRTGGFPAQRASNAENVSIWWRHHEVPAPSMSSLYIGAEFSHHCSCSCPLAEY